MSEIDLQEGKIKVEGEWLSVDDLTQRIQAKISAGDMKFSGLAAALEALNIALENSHTIQTTLVITKAEYEKLKALGGDDDLTCVRKAIMAFIGSEGPGKSAPDASSGSAVKSDVKKKKAIKCAKCNAAIEITTDEIPSEIECPECGTFGRLKTHNKS